MPIKIPNQLPATSVLTSENIFVMTETRAITQDIRPLQILLLNLMPTKIETETQLARVLGNTPIQIELELIAPSGHVSKNTSQAHMLAFYKSFDEVRDRTFDGLVITGAPVENLPFEEVDYWPELCEIMEWSKTHVHSTLHICWGAQAGLYYGKDRFDLERYQRIRDIAAVTIRVRDHVFTTVKAPAENPRALMEFADIDLANGLFNGKVSTINEMCKGNIRLAGVLSMVDNVNRILDRVAVYLG